MTLDSAMDCEESRRLIPFFLDDELDAEQSLLVEVHVAACEGCQKELQQEGELRVALRQAAKRVVAPESLRRRINAEIAASEKRPSGFRRMVPLAAAAALLIALAGGQMFDNTGDELSTVTARHARNLPMDVSGADWQSVQSYLNTRLPFSVRQPEVGDSQSAALVGGRITQVGNQEAAYLRYRLPRGHISIFVYQDQDGNASEVAPGYRMGRHEVMMRQMKGLNIARWREGGLVYSVVSELPERELQAFFGMRAR